MPQTKHYQRFKNEKTNVQLLTKWTRPEYIALHQAALEAGESKAEYLRKAAAMRFERETGKRWFAKGFLV